MVARIPNLRTVPTTTVGDDVLGVPCTQPTNRSCNNCRGRPPMIADHWRPAYPIYNKHLSSTNPIPALQARACLPRSKFIQRKRSMNIFVRAPFFFLLLFLFCETIGSGQIIAFGERCNDSGVVNGRAFNNTIDLGNVIIFIGIKTADI